MLRFVRRGDGIQAGERARVVSVDEDENRLRLVLEKSGLPCRINPRHRSGFEVERVQEKRFAVGDRIQFRERDRSLDVANGTVGTIKKLDHAKGIATVEVGSRRFRMELREPRAIDHAYAVTSHRSQGLSRERVYLAVDTSHSEELVNRRQFYVGVSRAVEDARIYTDDRQALVRAVSREQGRESALQLVEAVPAGRQSRAAALKRETPLDLKRSHDEQRSRADRRALGGAHRSQNADGGRLTPGRGAEGPARADRGASGPERGSAQGAHRVPRPDHERVLVAGREANGPGGPADRSAEGLRGQPVRVGPGRGPAEASDPASTLAPARGSGGGGHAGRLPGRQHGDLDDEPGHNQDSRGDRERTAAERISGEGGSAAYRRSRPLSREDIDRSPALARRYAQEYRIALRLVPDRELAKQIARLNLTVAERGEQPLVTRDVVKRMELANLGRVLARDGGNLSLLRGALTLTRVVSRSIEAGIGHER